MKKRLLIAQACAIALALLTLIVAGVALAATSNAALWYHDGTIALGGTATSIADGVAAPDDGKWVELDPWATIVMRFPDGAIAVPDGTAAPDLRIDTNDDLCPAEAHILVSMGWPFLHDVGVLPDTANIDIDLDLIGPVKYVWFAQASHYIDPTCEESGFDLDAVVALNAGDMVFSLEPADATNVPSEPHTVCFTAETDQRVPVSDVSVSFVARRDGETLVDEGDASTNVDGVACWTYTNTVEGTDWIYAWADWDGDGEYDEGSDGSLQLVYKHWGTEFVPEWGSVGLLASGLMGLAGYATLRLRKK
jgi:hypothetical protein